MKNLHQLLLVASAVAVAPVAPFLSHASDPQQNPLPPILKAVNIKTHHVSHVSCHFLCQLLKKLHQSLLSSLAVALPMMAPLPLAPHRVPHCRSPDCTHPELVITKNH